MENRHWPAGHDAHHEPAGQHTLADALVDHHFTHYRRSDRYPLGGEAVLQTRLRRHDIWLLWLIDARLLVRVDDDLDLFLPVQGMGSALYAGWGRVYDAPGSRGASSGLSERHPWRIDRSSGAPHHAWDSVEPFLYGKLESLHALLDIALDPE